MPGWFKKNVADIRLSRKSVYKYKKSAVKKKNSAKFDLAEKEYIQRTIKINICCTVQWLSAWQWLYSIQYTSIGKCNTKQWIKVVHMKINLKK